MHTTPLFEKILRGDFSNKKEKKSFLHRLVSQETFPLKGKPISKAKTENVNDKKQSVMKQAKPARGEAESMGDYKAASGERTA